MVKVGETTPATTEAMFTILCDRLDDIDDLLLEDVSPREAWAGIDDERVIRREIARELRSRSNGAYTVDQEAATADEKETDIRLRVASTGQQAIIELKVGEKPRSASQLLETLREQLLKKYMAPHDCRAGCLLISVATDRTWQHPHTKMVLDLAALIDLLNAECHAIMNEMGGGLKMMAKGLDLRARLPTERNRNSGSKK